MKKENKGLGFQVHLLSFIITIKLTIANIKRNKKAVTYVSAFVPITV